MTELKNYKNLYELYKSKYDSVLNHNAKLQVNINYKNDVWFLIYKIYILLFLLLNYEELGPRCEIDS